ncbi:MULTISPECIES: SDR family NAD(P)-dependent oxidoreductase [unclassified Pseudomonas]|uniref:SDR family NAD(P)-dependent oxidoreductase n=1 Tax=unclassified Pseudomonas TaxID=196821 RepID=UPI0025D9DFC9|nr:MULTISPECIES: SDR family NAD(P)-dependent oxidoreductase [unclassified Pseudomonas]
MSSPAVSSNGAMRHVLITGAAQGIGAGVARYLASRGYRIAAADLNEASCQATVNGLPGSGHSAWRMDVAQEPSVDTTFAAIEAEHGPVDAIVCAAGILILHEGERRLIADTELDEWELTHAVNTRGTFLCTRAFVRARRLRAVDHGRIVTFSSCAAQLGGYRSSSAYISSKAAVLGYTKALARETAGMGITVNGIAPGLIDTAMLRLSMAPGQEAAAAANIPLGRLGQPDDIAAAIAFLISPEASYITGTMTDVNGGYRMQ